MIIQALIVYSPANPLCSGIADKLSDELVWRGFAPVVRAGRDLDPADVDAARVVALVFPALPLAMLPGIPLGGMPSIVRSMGSLRGKAVGVLAVSPLPLRRVAEGISQLVEEAGGELISADSVPPLGPRGAIVDLAADCMVRVPH